MWWYKILGDNEESISYILRLDPITEGSILLTVKIVPMKRGNYDPILTVKRTEWRKFIDYFGQSIETYSSRVGKKNVYFVHIWYIPSTSSVNLHISSHQVDKQFNFEPQNLCMYQLTKTFASGIYLRTPSALRYLQLGKIFCCFRRLSFKNVL